MSNVSKPVTFPREFPGIHYYDEEEEQAALRVIRKRALFRYYGANQLGEADALEREFSRYLGVRHAQATASGSSALMAAMYAFGIGPGHEVLVPGFMWVSTLSAIVRAGAIPVLVEVDDSFTMDPEDLARKLSPHSRLILPVHMCGVPSDMPAILDIAHRHGVPVLEDCAQAAGAKLQTTPVGSFGDAAIFSFQMNKNLTAGEGGIFVTKDELLYSRANAAHDVGVPWEGGRPQQNSEHALWGVGARLNEISAALVRVQLRKLDQITRRMRESKRVLKRALGDLPQLTWRRVDDPDGDSGPFLISVFDSEDLARAFIREAVQRGLPILHLPDYGLHIYSNIRALTDKRSHCSSGFPWTHPANQQLDHDYRLGALPKSDELFRRSVVMAVPSRLTAEQMALKVRLFREAHGAASNNN